VDDDAQAMNNDFQKDLIANRSRDLTKMRRRVISAVCAGLIVALAASGEQALNGFPRPLLAWIAFAPLVPGIYAAGILGLGPNVHGLPTPDNVWPYPIAFVLWWLVIEVGPAWLLGRTHAQPPRSER